MGSSTNKLFWRIFVAAAIVIFAVFRLFLGDIYFRGSSFVQAIVGVTLSVALASFLTAVITKKQNK
jgi:hypothetical protein